MFGVVVGVVLIFIVGEMLFKILEILVIGLLVLAIIIVGLVVWVSMLFCLLVLLFVIVVGKVS